MSARKPAEKPKSGRGGTPKTSRDATPQKLRKTPAKRAPARRSTPAAARRPGRKPASAPAAEELTNVAGVRRDLEELGPVVSRSGLAATALTLARDLDNKKNSATSHAMCSKALLDVMNRLRELAPPKRDADAIDKLGSRVENRRQRLRAVK